MGEVPVSVDKEEIKDAVDTVQTQVVAQSPSFGRVTAQGLGIGKGL